MCNGGRRDVSLKWKGQAKNQNSLENRNRRMALIEMMKVILRRTITLAVVRNDVELGVAKKVKGMIGNIMRL